MAGLLYLSDYANGILPLTDCLGDTFCENAMKGFKDEVLRLMAGSGREVNQAFLMGKNGWNDFQSGVLDKVPVVLIGGKKFTKPGQVNPAVWPNDGLVALQRRAGQGRQRPGTAAPALLHLRRHPQHLRVQRRGPGCRISPPSPEMIRAAPSACTHPAGWTIRSHDHFECDHLVYRGGRAAPLPRPGGRPAPAGL